MKNLCEEFLIVIPLGLLFIGPAIAMWVQMTIIKKLNPELYKTLDGAPLEHKSTMVLISILAGIALSVAFTVIVK